MKLRVGKGALAPCPPHGVNWWARGVYHRARVRATRWLCLPYENPRFNFQTTAVNSLRHCRARPGNPSSSKMVLRRLMDARVKPGHDECRHLDSRRTFTPSRREASEALLNLPPNRGRGERRMPVAPAVSCALGSGRTHTSNNGALPGDRAVLPPSPADMFCLSPVGPT